MPKTVKIPRKIAGVKLPKQVRRKAKKAIKAGAGPVVREIAAAALGAAAKAGGTRERVEALGRSAEALGRRFEGRARIGIDGNKIGEAFRTAAIDGLRRFLEGFEEGLRKADGKGDDSQPAPPAAPAAAPKPPKPTKPPKPAKPPKPPKPSPAKPGARGPGV